MKKEKKGFFTRMFEGLDKKMKEKAEAASCGCCCGGEAPAKGSKKGNNSCCK